MSAVNENGADARELAYSPNVAGVIIGAYPVPAAEE